VTEIETSTDKDTSNLNLSADTVKAALTAMEKAGDATPEQAQLLWWFFCHCRESGMTLKQAAQACSRDSTTVYRVWTNKYGAKIDGICNDLARYRKISEARATKTKLGFVETSTYKIIERVCNAALHSQTVAFIWGDPQIGKTTCLEEYARRNNHGQTKLFRMPASAGVQLMMKELARVCYVSPESCFEKLRERVINAIDDKTLLIVDEVHQVFTSYLLSSAIKSLEVLREIYDRTGCGLVLCSTNVGRDEFEGGKLSKMLEQLRRRGTIKIQLSSRPPKGDLDRISKAFGLPPADGEALEVVKSMIHTSGLGMYIKFLHNAAQLAQHEDRKLSWDHFVKAHDIIARLSNRKEE
jgi:DNA transposition AAA+ family ATPase